MQYHRFQDLKLSALGLGCMRLPVLEGNYGKIDMEKTKELVKVAKDHGINYFDTAWGYHEGTSEIAIGQALKEYPRESFYLASKFPGFNLENMAKKEEIFEKQLSKCQVEYFDFYLFHNVWEKNIDGFLDPELGVVEYLLEQKKNGRIRHLGFSTHGSLATMKRFLDALDGQLEFCQIQLNWLDWELQDAKKKVELIRSYGLPVWVMEPVRGGRLVQLPEKYTRELKKLQPEWTLPQWAFRFLQSIEGVTMTLSGMSDLQQLQDNIATYASPRPLNDQEMAALLAVADRMTVSNTMACTGCRYCTEKCPQTLDIPWLVERSNERLFSGGKAVWTLPERAEGKDPASCIGCQNCESVCPQNIHISDMMADFTANLE